MQKKSANHPSGSQTHSSPPASGLEALLRAIPAGQTVEGYQNAAPVECWNPEYCGDLNMIIRADGRWDYENSPIGRQKLVRLFASVLKREGDNYYLVTPVEKIGIEVEDVPFIAIAMQQTGEGKDQELVFETNVGDIVRAGNDNQLRFAKEGEEKLKPYLHIRHGLEARLSRPVYYELANLAQPENEQPEAAIGIWSGGCFFPIGPAGED